MSDIAESLELRPLAEEDADELRRIHREPAVARWWDEPEPDFPWDEPESPRLTVLVDGAVAGLVQYWEEPEPKYRHAGIDLFLDPAVHGRGIGTEVVRRVVRLLVEERGHHRVTIDPAVDNVAAIRAYERAGFRAVGVLRRSERDADGRGWHDSVLMELLAGEAGAAPSESLVVLDGGVPAVFSREDLLRYHGPASPEGVERAYEALRRGLPQLGGATPPERREIRVRTVLTDPGALDAFELVTRAVTEGRCMLDPTLEGGAVRLSYRGRAVDV